jgi:eukaryotic-like serine/threonine-protein kinase
VDELIGQRISHYQILDVAGRGGMGLVFRALDTQLNRTVALKIIHSELLNAPGARNRFRRAALAASGITHPNIAHVYEVGEADGVNFMAMEFVEGETLDHQLHESSFGEQRATAIGIQLAEALEAAHAKGVIHRDIKPANVIVGARGHVKVLDFGLAKVLRPESEENESADTITSAGTIVGSVQYMSPEQALGEAVDYRSDIFSLGVVLYRMVTGRLPFQGHTNTETLSRIISSEPEAIARFNYSVSPEFERIVRKCLQKDPGRRYQSATELAVDLSNLRTDSTASGVKPALAARPARRWNRAWIAAALAVAAILLAGYGAYRYYYRPVDTIAVLPLLNLTGDPELEYLADGITDNLINTLSRVSSLTVRPRGSVFRFKERYQKNELDLQAAASQLKVNAILTGRVVRQEGDLVINAELTDINSNRQTWGQQYKPTMGSVFQTQGQIAREIAANLQLSLTAAERAKLTKSDTTSSEAEHLYLKGRYHGNRRTVESLKSAIDFYHQAIAKDPTFARAYAGIAESYMMGNVVHPREVFPRAKQAAQKAIELDPSAPEPYAALGYIALHYDWNWAEAEAAFHKALALNPRYATAHSMYARYLSVRERSTEAISEMTRAQELDPLALGINTGVGLCYYLSRQPEKAIEQYNRTLEFEPRFPLARFNLGAAYTLTRAFDRAVAEYQAGLQITKEDAGAMAELGYTYAVAGQPDQARALLKSVHELEQKRYVSPYYVAMLHAGLGEADEAFRYLQRAYEERNAPIVFLKVEPRWDGIRSDPRFRELLGKLALQ